jgi:hypothetical protein
MVKLAMTDRKIRNHIISEVLDSSRKTDRYNKKNLGLGHKVTLFTELDDGRYKKNNDEVSRKRRFDDLCQMVYRFDQTN